MPLVERVEAAGFHVLICREIQCRAEECARVAPFMPAVRVVMGIRIGMGVPDIVILRVVEQVVDQPVAVVVVDRAVGEYEALEAGENGMAAGGAVDDYLITRIAHGCVDQPEAESDRIDAAIRVYALIAWHSREAVISGGA